MIIHIKVNREGVQNMNPTQDSEKVCEKERERERAQENGKSTNLWAIQIIPIKDQLFDKRILNNQYNQRF